MAQARFIAGDPLRGIACLSILVFHVSVAGTQINRPGPITPLLRGELGVPGPGLYGLAMGVWLFFALSGYLIGGPLVRAVVAGTGGRPRLRSYARNRVLRIVPAFWVFLTVTVLLTGTMGNAPRQTALFYVFGHIYDPGPFTARMVQAWTLDVEAAFYVVAPLLLIPLALLLRGRGTPRTRAVLLIAGATVVAAGSLVLRSRNPATDWHALATSGWAFAPGIALAALEPLVRERVARGRSGRPVAGGLLCLGVGAFFVYAYAFDAGLPRNLAAFLAVFGLFSGPLVMQWSTGRCWRGLDNRVLHWFGRRSYGIYLAHVLVIFELRHVIAHGGSPWGGIALGLPLVLGISTAAGALSYRFVERPFLDRRLPWRPSESARARATPPAPTSEPVVVSAGPVPA